MWQRIKVGQRFQPVFDLPQRLPDQTRECGETLTTQRTKVTEDSRLFYSFVSFAHFVVSTPSDVCHYPVQGSISMRPRAIILTRSRKRFCFTVCTNPLPCLP